MLWDGNAAYMIFFIWDLSMCGKIVFSIFACGLFFNCCKPSLRRCKVSGWPKEEASRSIRDNTTPICSGDVLASEGISVSMLITFTA